MADSPLNAPLISLFAEEIESAQLEEKYLTTIILVGACSELILREIADVPRKNSYSETINKARKSHRITSRQEELFRDIKLLRDKYVHIDANRIIKLNLENGVFVEIDGLLDHINEPIYAAGNNDELKEAFKLTVSMDANAISNLFNKLYRTF